MNNQQEVMHAKECLKRGLPIPPDSVRDVILESWQRCKAQDVPMEHGDKGVLPHQAVEQRIAQRQPFCQVAVPYLDVLYNFIRGSNFLVILSDEEGYLLYERGDPEILDIARQNALVKGACRSEARLGTNGVGTVLATQQPLQVFAAEHYYEVHRDWACSGAPIFLPDGRVGGVVCLSGMAHQVNYHTLGMVVAAADAISRQLKLKAAYDELDLARQNLDIIIETVPSALFLLDKNLRVLAYNAQATKLLDLVPKQLCGADLLELLGCDSITPQDFQRGIANRSITLERGRKKYTFSLSVQPTGSQEYVVQLERLSALHRRVNNIMGNDAHFSFADIIGNSSAMWEALHMAQIAAQNDANVFLTGESGTGKELFAQAIHNASARRDGPFIAVNCGALPKSLIEAELFGYESGSFTGAKREGCAGKFELANGGTIFLDEIGDTPFDVQVTLLRVLQNREIRRIGASKTVHIDVRIITATNQNLEELVAQHAFREDLFYRINVFHIQIPPLRARTGDVRLLAEYFLRKYVATLPSRGVEGFSPDAMAILEGYSWPGNVRQLENTVERAVYLADTPLISPADLPQEVRDAVHSRAEAEPAPSGAADRALSIRQGERERIEQALHQTHGNVKQAAELLEISRRTLYRKLDLYQIDYQDLRH